MIATEFAQMFTRLDLGVTIIGSADRIMPQEEPRLADQLAAVLTSDGVTIRTGLTVRRIERHGTEHVLFGAGKDAPDEVRELAIADMILLAAVRKPVVDLRLDRAGVEFDAKAGITVDAFLRTSAAHIWAAGDCATPQKFTHVAHYQAEQLAANILAEIRGHGDVRPITD